jgi:hypothetical protein
MPNTSSALVKTEHTLMKKINNAQDAIEQEIEGGWRSDLHKANPHAEIEPIVDNAALVQICARGATRPVEE